ncbi:hypothetical protein GOBAR_AA23409 [Gossypium barbadense]|uniref:Disease resistance protein RPS4B/Roq1-like leucine-rich repeats domain-containing protein n=1 Tax=Gossypium barbadense TaxID=3634 RepID=A0A2P5X1R8_GOSBA|nr:hypothetical protein GOBAR_AA23409 [Gossypium barbadense]
MKRLRLLKVHCLPNCCDLTYLSNKLRLLEWSGYSLRSLPLGFQPENLVVLLLPYSNIEQLWKENTPLYKLKVLNLKGSGNLIKAPDVITAPNLEILVLEGCTRLVYVHPSVGVLTRLKILNLGGCKSLRSFPTRIRMGSLEMLILSGCSKLQSFPEIDGKMECSLEVCFDGTNIKELPSSIENLRRLEVLNLKDCKSLRSFPTKIGMESLEKLILSGCSNLKRFPEIDGKMECLQELYLDGTGIKELPILIGNLSSLVLLNLKDCMNLVDLPGSTGQSKDTFSSRPVTRSYAKAHNNLVSEPVVMGDEKTLTAKLEAFMEQMATRQQVLEEQMAILSLSVQKTTKENLEKNNEEQGSSGGKKRNSNSQHGGGMVPRYSKMEFPTYDGVGDPLGWLKRCENFFNNQRTNEEAKSA